MPDEKKRVLITGAYGLIGNLLYAHLAAQPDRYETYGMVRRVKPSNRATELEFHPIPDDHLRVADLTDAAAVHRAAEGMDVIVHLAADADGRSGWESILNNNIIGTHNVFEAAREAGAKRVIYASSNQVAFGYLGENLWQVMRTKSIEEVMTSDFHRVAYDDPTHPINYYGCSKVFGENLARMYATVHQMSCICLRIGWVLAEDKPIHRGAQLLWCSQRDCIQVIERSINAPADLRYDVFFVQSDNAYNFVDIQHTKDVLGYEPKDRAQDYI